MKVKCIDNYDLEKSLTIGKIYDVILIGTWGDYRINDEGYEWWYPKKYFKPLSEIRNETINKLLEDES